jgi:hypothetical protein
MASRYVVVPFLLPEHSPKVRAERERLQRNKERKRRLEEAKHQLEVAQRKGDYEAASRLRYSTIPELEREIPTEGSGTDAMLGERVTSDDIVRVVARSTGIPVQSLLKGERERLVHVRDFLYSLPFFITLLVDGGCIAGSRCWARPRCRCDQRRGPDFAGWAAGPHATCGFVLVPGPDGGREGMRCMLLLFSASLAH